MQEALDEVYKMLLHNFHAQAILGAALPYYWARPCNFEILKYRLFLEPVCVGKQELELVSDPSSKGHEIPPLPPYIQSLGRRLDFGFCLD